MLKHAKCRSLDILSNNVGPLFHSIQMIKLFRKTNTPGDPPASLVTEQFVPPGPLQTAVLFLVFNRPDTTAQVFEAIRQAKPPRLYVAGDGPRSDRAGEQQKVDEVRRIATDVDWPCEVKTFFREENLGCKYAVSGAITWFFGNEEQGIILEDDCLPRQSFFWFCEDLLRKYNEDMRVWHIAGNNFHFGWQRDRDYSYYFSYYGSIWGWATWRNRWDSYTVEMDNYREIREKNYFLDVLGNQREADFRIRAFNLIESGFDTWDFQWNFARLTNSGLSVVPIVNLVSNLGFGEDGTHTKESSKWARMDTIDLHFELSHPSFVIRDKLSDDRFFQFIDNSNIIKITGVRIARFLRKIFTRIK